MATLQYVKPTDEQLKTMQAFRDRMEDLYNDIKTEVPEGRGKALALTKLEESAMWLNKAITLND